jgi:hydroxymethylpyrimidine pyrophosphatase-like HAD family hydrolase
MGIRMIAMDIDGTLLDSKWEVPEANRKAIVEAAGHKTRRSDGDRG